MKAVLCLIVLGVTAAASAATLTGNELILLRMILRQGMAEEVAAADPNNPSAVHTVDPLQMALLDMPQVQELRPIVNDPAQALPLKLNAARALAYFGDPGGTQFLSGTVEGLSRSFSRTPARSHAGLALLYLGYDLPPDFAFSKLSPTLYPELDAFLAKPSEWPSVGSPYRLEELQAAIRLHFGSSDPVQVRGPLSVVTIEQESLATVLREASEHPDHYLLRVPFGNRAHEWEEFKDEVRTTDDLYHFILGNPASEAQPGTEGYASIREGQVVAVILTKSPRLTEADVLAFDDFAGRLDLDWNILNSDPSHWSLSRVPGALTITTQDGTFVRARRDYRNVFLVNCPAAPGQDFQVTTCLLSFAPAAMWNQAGLLLWNDDNQYLKFNYEFCNDPLGSPFALRIHTLAVEGGGSPVYTWYAAEQNPQRLWLRIVKRGEYCDLFTSTDGQSFAPPTVLATDGGPADNRVYCGNGAVQYTGLYAENGSADGATPVDASFDFFEVRALPAGPQ
ncbi:MAG: hypothetical protein JW955_09360 [Sedimentisphaerales bacterium]|nr:hypothetical protein [Sedimentisphaerales bacterium]